MAITRQYRFGPTALTATLTTNLLNCNVTSLAGPVGFTLSQPFILLKRLRVVNKSTTTSATFSLWIGLTGANTAGTEFIGTAQPVAAQNAYDWVAAGVGLRLDAADFLVGGANVATTLTLQGEFEIGISG